MRVLRKSTREHMTALFIVCALCFCSLPIKAEQKFIPVEHFFKNQQLSDVQLSPDGKFVAILTADSNDRVMLAVMEIGNPLPKVIARYSTLDVIFFHWVNNKRLVYGISDKALGEGENRAGTGLFAIDKDGANSRQLIERTYTMEPQKFRMLPARTSFIDVSNIEDSDDVFVAQVSGDRKNSGLNLLKLNTVTGYTESIPVPSYANSFLIDKTGQPRTAVTNHDNLTSVFYKDPQKQEWRKLIQFDANKDDGFTPAFISPDGTLYVTTHNGQNTTSVYRFDFERNKIDNNPLISLEGYDFNGQFLYEKKSNKLLGLRYETDAPAATWLDDDWKKLQEKVDALLPDTVNIISGAVQKTTHTVLIKSFSDVHPGSYFLFNTTTTEFTPLGNVRPEIDSKSMSYKDFVKYKARDGLEIPAYLTVPKGSSGKNLPMVVLVHGGPYVRGGHWAWNAQVQFLASRGYAVLEPDFRGSTGYGNKLYRSGWKQWGLKMQDDIDDGRKWAIEQGYANPERVCIAGASYGGYAVLMGLIRNPDLYRCGISWVGVSDINLLYDIAWSDQAGSSWQRYGMPVLIGDQEKDAVQLKATSPIEQASRLNNPLILAYGGADVRVPLVHGTKFYNAAKHNNKNIEWIVYPEEAHGWRLLKNNIDFWTRVEKFLDQNIGKH